MSAKRRISKLLGRPETMIPPPQSQIASEKPEEMDDLLQKIIRAVPDENTIMVCKTPTCRVETYRYGDGSDNYTGILGRCPHCYHVGKPR